MAFAWTLVFTIFIFDRAGRFSRESCLSRRVGAPDATQLLHITSFLLLSIWPYPLRFEDHLLRISGQQISADVPMRLNVSAVAPRKGIRQRVCHQPAETPHPQLARACKSGERPRQLLIFDNNWSRLLPQSGRQMRPARHPHRYRRQRLRRLRVNVLALQHGNVLADRIWHAKGRPREAPAVVDSTLNNQLIYWRPFPSYWAASENVCAWDL
jgi:hypothetical protein